MFDTAGRTRYKEDMTTTRPKLKRIEAGHYEGTHCGIRFRVVKLRTRERSYRGGYRWISDWAFKVEGMQTLTEGCATKSFALKMALKACERRAGLNPEPF